MVGKYPEIGLIYNFKSDRKVSTISIWSEKTGCQLLKLKNIAKPRS